MQYKKKKLKKGTKLTTSEGRGNTVKRNDYKVLKVIWKAKELPWCI